MIIKNYSIILNRQHFYKLKKLIFEFLSGIKYREIWRRKIF